MNIEEIDFLKKKYSCFDLEKRRLENVKKRIIELEQDLKIKEYLNLIDLVKNNDGEKNQKNFDDSVSKLVSYTKNSNKLLFKYGSVQVATYEQPGSDETYPMKIFRDLETTEYYFEMIDTLEPIPPEWRVLFNSSDRDFYNLRRYFIEQIINRPQEEVVEELLKNNKQLVKGK